MSQYTEKGKNNRLIIKVTHDTLPQIKDRYPFLYLERGRLEIDDSSVKWLDSSGEVIRLPIATITTLLLGPGTSVTHEAIKVLAAANCNVCWVGEDSLLLAMFKQSVGERTKENRPFRSVFLFMKPIPKEVKPYPLFVHKNCELDLYCDFANQQ